MALYLILAACLLGTTMAVQSFDVVDGGGWGGHKNGGWGGGLVVSRRDSGAEAIYEQVHDILEQAETGIVAADLEAAAISVGAAADAYLDANGGEVAAEDVEAVIDEVAATLNGAVAISALFDDPVTFEAALLDSAFCLWKGLVAKAEQLEEAGQSPNAAIAAIRMTAEAIANIVENTVGIITYLAANDHEEERSANPSKRWTVSGGVSHGPGGTSYNVGVSHSWRRRRAAEKRGQWSGSLNAGYSQSGGASVSGSVSYSWGKR